MARDMGGGGKALTCLRAKKSCTCVNACSCYNKCEGLSFSEMGWF